MSSSISILGCGWLGRPLANQFLNLGYEVKGSTTSIDKLEILKSEGVYPYLIHIEELSSEVKSFLNSETLIVNITSKNVCAFANLIALIRESQVRNVLLISSTSVYDPANYIITEETDTNKSPLARIEKYFLKENKFNTTVLRFGGLFGYDRQPGRFFKNGNMVTDPDGYVNYIHRDDCIEIIAQIVRNNVWSEVFNGVTDTHPTKKEFYTYMAQIIGKEPPKFGRNTSSHFKLVSNEKLKNILNYKFKLADLMSYQQEITV